MGRSRSALFLMEQIIVTAVFAICAALCVKILATSYIMADNSRSKSTALRTVQSAAECFKALSGDAAAAAVTIGGTAGGPVYYDEDWQLCGEAEAAYRLTFTDVPPDAGSEGLSLCEISVQRADGSVIVGLTAAARRGST